MEMRGRGSLELDVGVGGLLQELAARQALFLKAFGLIYTVRITTTVSLLSLGLITGVE
jgi:hypothetical protein